MTKETPKKAEIISGPRHIAIDATGHDTQPQQSIEGFVSPASFWTPEFVEESAWIDHAPFAFWLMDVLRPRTLVELGTHNGYSYFAFCQAVKALGLDTRCYAVDNWRGDEHAGFYGEEVFDRVRDYNESHYPAFSRLVRSNFDDALAHFSDSSIDLLHIDGRHFYEDVRHDFQGWRSKLSKHAVVLFHDTNVRERKFGVFRFWEELAEGFPNFDFLHGHGLGVLGYGSELPDSLRALFEAGPDLATSIRAAYARLGSALKIEFTQRRTQAKVSAKLKSTEERVGELEARLATRDAEARELESRAEAGKAEVTALGARLQTQEARVGELEAKLEARELEFSVGQGRIKDLESTLEARDAEARELESRAQAGEAEITTLTAKLQAEESRADEVGNKLAARDAELATARARIEELESAAKAAETEVNELASRLETERRETEEAREKLKAEATELSRKHAARVEELTRLSRLALDTDDALQRQQARTSSLEAEVEALYASRSWRLTAPLRAVWHIVRRLTDRGRVARAVVRVALTKGPKSGYRLLKDRRLLLSSGAFDSGYYRRQNPDVAAARSDPALHYLLYGADEGRNPNSLFDAGWYLKQNPDVAEGGINPLVHYLRFGASEGRDPSPRFDNDWYLNQNPDVAEAGMNALAHYTLHGAGEGRAPHPISAGSAEKRKVNISQ